MAASSTLHEGTARQILRRLVAVSMTTTRKLDQGIDPVLEGSCRRIEPHPGPQQGDPISGAVLPLTLAEGNLAAPSSISSSPTFWLERIGDPMVLPPCARLYEAILWLFITPGDLIAYGLGVKGRNRDLVINAYKRPFLDCGCGGWIGDLDINPVDLSMTGADGVCLSPG